MRREKVQWEEVFAFFIRMEFWRVMAHSLFQTRPNVAAVWRPLRPAAARGVWGQLSRKIHSGRNRSLAPSAVSSVRGSCG